MFLDEGVLNGVCAAAPLPITTATSAPAGASPPSAAVECPEQVKRLGVVFVCGSWSVQACRMVTGLLRDRYGTRVTVLGVMLLVAVGIVLLGLAPPNSLALLSIGYFLLGVGAGVQLCMQSVAMLFGKYQGTVSAALSGGFTASAAVPLIIAESIRALVDDSNSYRHARLVVMLGYAGLVILSAGSALWLMPRGGDFNEVLAVLKGSGGGGDSRGGGRSSRDEDGMEDGDCTWDAHARAGAETTKSVGDVAEVQVVAVKGGMEGAEEGGETCAAADASKPPPLRKVSVAAAPNRATHEGKTARAQLMSLDFIFLASWFTVMLLPNNFFIISIGDQLEDMGDDDRSMTTGFALVWVLSTLVAPIAGLSADFIGRGATMTFSMGCYVASFALLGVGGGGSGDNRFGGVSLNAQWITFVTFNVGRLWLFSMYFVSVGRLFGFAHYGTLAGVGLLMSAFATPLAVPMLRHGVDNGWAQSNAACVAISAACVCFTAGWTWRREAREHQARTEAKAGQAQAREKDAEVGLMFP